MEISVSTGLYYKKSYKETLDIIASTSCKNIELFLNEKFIAAPLIELEKEVTKRNLSILSIHTPLEYIAFKRKESEAYWINKSIEFSKVFGAKVIVSHMVNGKFYDGNADVLDELHRKNMMSYTNAKDVYVTTENLPCSISGSFLQRYDELFNFISQHNISLTFDTTHSAFSKKPIIESYSLFKPFIKNIHLSDFDKGIEHKVLGEGSLPLKEFISQLKEDNYEGIITIELDFDNQKRNNILNNDHAAYSIQKSIDYIKDSII